MAQTVRKRLASGTIATPTLVVVDEAHLDEWAPIAEAFPLAHYLLLTATPLRSSGRSWHGLADALVEVETVAGLVAAGHLVEPVVYSAQSPDLAGIRRGAGGELSATQAGARYQASAIMGDTVQQVLTRCAGLRVLVFASSVEHSKALDDAMRAAGLRSHTSTARRTPRCATASLPTLRQDTSRSSPTTAASAKVGRANSRRGRRCPSDAVREPVAADGRTRAATRKRQGPLRHHRPGRQCVPPRAPACASHLDP
jgi:superfamily II DNA or RNA helicase